MDLLFLIVGIWVGLSFGLAALWIVAVTLRYRRDLRHNNREWARHRSKL